MKILFSIGLAALLAAPANAALKWEKTELDLHPSFSDKEAIGRFKYENTGTTTIKVTGVHTSCGCTVASLEKKEVAPGEKGEITATFKIGNRTGAQQKTVTVQTDDPSNPTTVLTLKAVIPALLEVQPTFVYWDNSKPLEAKTISIKAAKDAPVTKVTVNSSDPLITTKVEPGASPKEWKLSVLPKDSQPRTSTLTIQPDYPEAQPKLYYASVRVTNAPR